jgi:hypothetical protein
LVEKRSVLGCAAIWTANWWVGERQVIVEFIETFEFIVLLEKFVTKKKFLHVFSSQFSWKQSKNFKIEKNVKKNAWSSKGIFICHKNFSSFSIIIGSLWSHNLYWNKLRVIFILTQNEQIQTVNMRRKTVKKSCLYEFYAFCKVCKRDIVVSDVII